MAVIPEITLGLSGKTMPVIGMGTGYPVGPEATTSSILEAIRVGYRHFDTAFMYGSEQPLGVAVAEALRLSLVKFRDELHITTKLWCSFAHRDKVVPGIKTSLKSVFNTLATDLNPRCKPSPSAQRVHSALCTKSVWEGMEECLNLGLTKAIGVSNLSSKKLEEVLAIAKIPPAVKQVEMNPLWKQKKLREFCREKGIHITAYSPLGSNGTMWGDNRIVDCDVLLEIADVGRKFDRKYENSIKRGREIRFSERDVKNPSPPDHRTCGQVPPHVRSTTARAANLGTRAQTFWSILLRIKDRKSVTVRVRKLNTERREARVPKGETLPKLGKHFHGGFFFIFFLFLLLHVWLVVFPRVLMKP
ncbi:unnamed protein product [Camellia sinensis]